MSVVPVMVAVLTTVSILLEVITAPVIMGIPWIITSVAAQVSNVYCLL